MKIAKHKSKTAYPPVAAAAPKTYYKLGEIEAIAQKDFPTDFESIIDVNQLQWQTGECISEGLHKTSLFLGYIVCNDGEIVKVSACMMDAGRVELYARGVKLRREDHTELFLQGPWEYLAEEAFRAPMTNLKALVGYYFLVAGLLEMVWVDKKSWFKSLKVACRLVGLGVVLGEEEEEEEEEIEGRSEVGEVRSEEIGYEGGDEGDGDSVGGPGEGLDVDGLEEDGDGIDKGEVARILQRLLSSARAKNSHWTQHVEDELLEAWPGVKAHWK
jgi:hypothetical protein